MPSIAQSKVYDTLKGVGPTSKNKITLRITCSKCGDQETITGNPFWPTEAIGNAFRKKGWDVDNQGRKATCQECQPGSNSVSKGNGKVRESGQSKPAAMSTVQAYREIEVCFNIDDGRYIQGVSDKTIAMKYGLAPDVVAAIRRESFGELKTDPEIAKIQSDLATFARNLSEEIDDLRKMIDMIKSDGSKKIAEFQMRIEQAVKDLGK